MKWKKKGVVVGESAISIVTIMMSLHQIGGIGVMMMTIRRKRKADVAAVVADAEEMYASSFVLKY
ncbi:hypothetical protein G4V62_02480 [Bacillaceae bacterium SIJ1]|uniref:hypothetical protein n=1 Tax=Litoribacterium kuwaitense TaxID=1398745 RepID=UPI0013EDA13A|nr:hypothetical protein [Litoribacterium kuwaitense]NGP43867.1 hypothetical protein [Litoribacterium kuwaitense]